MLVIFPSRSITFSLLPPLGLHPEVNVMDPSFKVYAPWRDPVLLEEFPGRTQMLSFLQKLLGVTHFGEVGEKLGKVPQNPGIAAQRSGIYGSFYSIKMHDLGVPLFNFRKPPRSDVSCWKAMNENDPYSGYLNLTILTSNGGFRGVEPSNVLGMNQETGDIMGHGYISHKPVGT